MAQRIRIRLKAYDHRVLDQSARRIVELGRASGGGPGMPRGRAGHRGRRLRWVHYDR